MAQGLNKVLLMGHLGAAPTLSVTPNGQSVLKMRLATTESYVDKNSIRQERTEWHSVVIWGKRAEALAKTLGRGSAVFVEGGLRTTSYEKAGEKRYRTEIVASNILLSGRSNVRHDGAHNPYDTPPGLFGKSDPDEDDSFGVDAFAPDERLAAG